MNKIIILFSLVMALSKFTSAQSYTGKAAMLRDSYKSEYDGRYESAISDLLSVYKEDSYVLNLRLGWLYYLNNDQVKSIEYYNKAIALSPESVEPKLGLIYPVSAMGEWDKVVTMYEEIVAMAPGNTLVRYNLAYVYHNNFKKYKDALKHALVVVKLYPFDYRGNMLLGNIYRSLGKVKEAKSHYITAHYNDPDAEEALKALNGL